jgi:hypothetical protein
VSVIDILGRQSSSAAIRVDSERHRTSFWHEGQRYELRDWRDGPTPAERAAGMSVVRGEPQARWVLGATMRNGGSIASSGRSHEPWTDAQRGSTRELVDAVLDDLRVGKRLLVTIDARPLATQIVKLETNDADIVDLADLAEAESEAEDTWVEFVFEYPDGTKVGGLDYILLDPSQKQEPGTLAQSGTITKRGVTPGDYTVVLEEIEYAVWEKARGRVGDELKVIARTSGYPDGTAATIKLYRERTESPGDEIATVEAQVQGDVIEATLQYEAKDDAQKHETGVIGLIAEVSLDGGKAWAKTPRALQLQLETLVGVRWATARAAAGDAVELVVEALGYPPDTQVAIELWRLDFIEGDSKVCDVGPVPLAGTKAIARCTYGSPGAGDGAIEACGEYYAVATIEGSVTRTARSDLLWCVYDESSEDDADANTDANASDSQGATPAA